MTDLLTRKNTLTLKDIERAVKVIGNQKIAPIAPYVWIDNKYFYLGRNCKMLFGENPTEKELKSAGKKENGYIKQLRGIKLYLSKSIPTIKQKRKL